MNMMINQPMAPTMQTVNPMFTSYANFNMMMNPSLPYIIPNFHPIIIPNSTMMINQPMTAYTRHNEINTPSSLNTDFTMKKEG